MRPGVPAEIRATGAVGGVFAGEITRSAEALNAEARTMRVEVDMPNAGHALVPGMYVSVAFQLPPRGLAEVPAAALIFRASGTQVAQVDAHSKIQFRNVVIARDNGSLVELASGVQPGDKLVLFSDGLSEAANADGEFFEKKALKEMLCTYAGVGCAELHSKLVEAVEDFSEASEQEDDITMLVLEYQP